MFEKECYFSNIKKSEGGRDISIRGDKISFSKQVGPYLLQLSGQNDILKAAQSICNDCGACDPIINKVKHGIEIKRVGYKFEPINKKPFLEVIKYKAEGKSRGNITVVDDSEDASQLAEHVCTLGFNSYGIWVNRYLGYSHRTQNDSFNAIMKTKPHLLICDKGLGYHDGIKILSSFGDRCITIMYTGEPDTRETHQVAHHLVVKPHPEEIDRLIKRYFPK